MSNNFYFETLGSSGGELSEENVIRRIEECEIVLNEVVNSRLWDILLRDNKEMMANLDNNWQDIASDSNKLAEARILKMATKHIVGLPMLYAKELDALKGLLHKLQNPEEVIEKDSDNE